LLEFLKSATLAPLPKDAGEWTRKKVEDLKAHPKGENCSDIRTEMQNLMMEDVGIFRNEEGMQRRLINLGIKRTIPKEFLSMIKLSIQLRMFSKQSSWKSFRYCRIVAISGINRKESRGAHAREEFHRRDDANF